MDNYYLKHYSTRKVDTYTYEYDKWEDTMSSGKKYYVNIVFENDKFSRIDFQEDKSKRFDTNLREKELYLLNKLQEEIKNIEGRREEEKWDITKVNLKSTSEQIELINSVVNKNPVAIEAFKSAFGSVLSFILDKIKVKRIPFDKLNFPSVKIKIPLEYEIEIFNPDLVQKAENQAEQGPVEK